MILTDLHARPVIAHRGDSVNWPENTHESFERAVELGVDALEFDVRLTRDGVAVVMHDATVDRTTDGTGAVASQPLAALRELNAGAQFVSRLGTATHTARKFAIPTFEQMLDRYRTLPLLIEVKVPEAVPEVQRLVAKFSAQQRVLLDSTDHAAVAPFRGAGLVTGASMKDVMALLPYAWLPGPRGRLPYEALCIPRWYNGIPVPVARLASAARRVGTATHVWTVNGVSGAEQLWRAGVQGIITDDPGTMMTLRERMRAHGGGPSDRA